MNRNEYIKQLQREADALAVSGGARFRFLNKLSTQDMVDLLQLNLDEQGVPK